MQLILVKLPQRVLHLSTGDRRKVWRAWSSRRRDRSLSAGGFNRRAGCAM